MERDFETVTFQGKTYTLTCDTWVDNIGTNGDVVYYATAKDADNNEYKVMWYTTEQWDKSCELLNLEMRLKDIEDHITKFGCTQQSEQNEIELFKKQIAELEAEGICSTGTDDGSNACDWENPHSVTAV